MRKIKKITKTVAGSALLVGATLAGAASMGAAQSSGSSGATLSDYPGPFLDDDGTVDTTVVVGESARTADVLGASNIGATLSNAAFTTETVSASGGNFGWSASNGVTLSTQNDDLYFGDSLDTVRQTLTDEDLEILSETTFTDDSNEDTDVTNYLNVGSIQTTFGNSPDELDDEDPAFHVPVNAEDNVGSGDGEYLFNLQANFEESINFENGDVRGEEIELFGTTYTVAEDNDDNSDELVLYGSQESTSISTDEEAQTITVDGQEVTLSVTAVTDSTTAAVEVNGELEEYTEEESFTVNDQEVRVDNVIQTSTDESAGTVTFAIGSQEIVMQNEAQLQDEDGDDIEGSWVEFNGGTTDSITSLSSIDLYVGAEDDEEDAITAGETFSHSAVPGVEFHFGGMNPNAAEAEDVGTVEVTNNGDEDATVSFTSSGEDVTQNFIHYDGSDEDGDSVTHELADSDNDEIITREGANVFEDEYFVSDAGDFSHMWEVTSIDLEGEDTTIDLTDVATGDSREVELTNVVSDTEKSGAYNDQHEVVVGTEVIDGQTYYFGADNHENGETDDVGDPNVNIVYGDGAQLNTNDDGSYNGLTNTGGGGIGNGAPGATDVFTALDTESGAAVAFTTQVDAPYEPGNPEIYGFPSTESTDELTATVQTGSNADNPEDAVSGDDVKTSVDHGTVDSGDNYLVEAQIGEVVYDFKFDSDPSSGQTPLLGISVDADQDVNNDDGVNTQPSLLTIEAEDDSDREDAFVTTFDSHDSDDGYSFSADSAVTYTDGDLSLTPMEESDEDMEVGYTSYGTYVQQDTEDEGSVTLNVPYGQSVVGAAFTGADGSLSEGGSSGSVTSMSPTYDGEGFPADSFVSLDSEVSNPGSAGNMILVGGPSVNTLVSDLADSNQTWASSDYEEGDQVVQMVNDAFSEGQDALVVAGYASEDTRAAAQAVANWKEQDFSGSSQVNLATQ